MSSSGAICGGVGEEKQPDSTVIQMLEELRPQIEKKLGRQLTECRPIAYKSQLVNGVNYFIKIDIGKDEYIHVRVHRAFSGEKTLAAVQSGKRGADRIDYFDCDN